MTSALRIAIVACCLIIALLPAAAGGYVAATGLAVVEMNDREVDYRLTVVPSELPETRVLLSTNAIELTHDL